MSSARASDWRGPLTCCGMAITDGQQEAAASQADGIGRVAAVTGLKFVCVCVCARARACVRACVCVSSKTRRCDWWHNMRC